jgi:uncharacterized membrane protein YccF (DUF307 family)
LPIPVLEQSRVLNDNEKVFCKCLTKEARMALLGNIIWFFSGGLVLFFLYMVGAIFFFPMFIPLSRLAFYAAWPFGKGVVTQSQLSAYRKSSGKQEELSVAASGLRVASGVMNIVWLLTFGWMLALTHLVASFVNLCFFWTIVAIPNIVGNWKLIGIALMPFNKVVLPKALVDQINIGAARERHQI